MPNIKNHTMPSKKKKLPTSDEWRTPHTVFNLLDNEFHFTIDLAASSTNSKLDRFYSKEDSSLEKDWSGEIGYLNPPYSQKKTFVIKAYETVQNLEENAKTKKNGLKNTTIVVVIPAATDHKLWHNYCMKADEVRFSVGRIQFDDPLANRNRNRLGSAIIVFRYPRRFKMTKFSSFYFKGDKPNRFANLSKFIKSDDKRQKRLTEII